MNVGGRRVRLHDVGNDLRPSGAVAAYTGVGIDGKCLRRCSGRF